MVSQNFPGLCLGTPLPLHFPFPFPPRECKTKAIVELYSPKASGICLAFQNRKKHLLPSGPLISGAPGPRARIRDLFMPSMRWTTLPVAFLWMLSLPAPARERILLVWDGDAHRVTWSREMPQSAFRLFPCCARGSDTFIYYGLLILTPEYFREGEETTSNYLMIFITTAVCSMRGGPTRSLDGPPKRP